MDSYEEMTERNVQSFEVLMDRIQGIREVWSTDAGAKAYKDAAKMLWETGFWSDDNIIQHLEGLYNATAKELGH